MADKEPVEDVGKLQGIRGHEFGPAETGSFHQKRVYTGRAGRGGRVDRYEFFGMR